MARVVYAPAEHSRRWSTLLHKNVWYAGLGCLSIIVVSLFLYSPALRGPFIYDDEVLPISDPRMWDAPFHSWISGVRPTLMFTYWLNHQGAGTSSYHLLNILIHIINTGLIYLAATKLLDLLSIKQKDKLLFALLPAAVFLVHPLQTESVAYIAGRSESLAAMFFLAAFVVYLFRPAEGVGWGRSAAILLLFALGVTSKENAAVLPAVLLLTEWFQNDGRFREAIKTNWRLYVPMAFVALGALAFVGRVLATSGSAGFHLNALPWYQYFFTEWRAIFGYLGLFVWPLGQSIDHDFPISHSPLEHGAIIALILLLGVMAAALLFRRRYPLSAFSVFLFFLLLAPTSTVIPIADPFVERRMYLAALPLCLIAVEFLWRRGWWREPVVWTCVALLLTVISVATYRRNQQWGDAWAFWTNTVSNNPEKSRPYAHLVETAEDLNRCGEVVPYLQRADTIMPDDPTILISWAKVLECQGQAGPALLKMQRAVFVAPSSLTFELVGLLYGELGRFKEAKEALDKAVELGPASDTAYNARGLWYELTGRYDSAIRDYSHALSLNRMNLSARIRLARLERSIETTDNVRDRAAP